MHVWTGESDHTISVPELYKFHALPIGHYPQSRRRPSNILYIHHCSIYKAAHAKHRLLMHDDSRHLDETGRCRLYPGPCYQAMVGVNQQPEAEAAGKVTLSHLSCEVLLCSPQYFPRREDLHEAAVRNSTQAAPSFLYSAQADRKLAAFHSSVSPHPLDSNLVAVSHCE